MQSSQGCDCIVDRLEDILFRQRIRQCAVGDIQHRLRYGDHALCYVSDNLQEVRDMTADWLHRYNHHRPHDALGRIPPVEYRVKLFPNLYF